jgi:hypothetical protein
MIFVAETDRTRKSPFRPVDKIKKILSSSSALRILNEELVVKTPESLGEYSVDIQFSLPLAPKSRLRFPYSDIVNIRAHSMHDYSNQDQAVLRMRDCFEIAINKIKPTSDSILLGFDFQIKNDSFMKKLIRKDVQSDIPRGQEEEISQYWIHAQLKEPKILESQYGRLDLRDIDFSVNVAISQDLKTAIPRDFVRNMRIIAEWIKTKDRVKKWRLLDRALGGLYLSAPTGTDEYI